MSAQSHSSWQLGTKYVTLNDQTGYTVQTAAETTTQIDMHSSIDANHTETPRYTTNERRRLHRPAEQKGQRTPQMCDKNNQHEMGVTRRRCREPLRSKSRDLFDCPSLELVGIVGRPVVTIGI